MRFSKRLEKRFASSNLFKHSDIHFSHSARTSDAIVVAGFWRSGTTYLLEELAYRLRARSFFEPLHWSVPAAKPFHSDARFEISGAELSETYPYIRPSVERHDMDSFCEDMLCGRISTPWTRKARAADSHLKRNIIIKLVRGNLLLGYLQQRFGCRGVFILRHPGGVVASLQRGETNQKIYSSDKFLRILLEQEDVTTDHLSGHLEHIERWRATPLGRLMLAYSIINLVPLTQMKSGECNPYYVTYEELTLDPDHKLDDLARTLMEDSSLELRTRHANRASVTTKHSRQNVKPIDRCFDWQRTLESKDIDKIYRIIEGFGEPLSDAVAQIDALKAQSLG